MRNAECGVWNVECGVRNALADARATDTRGLLIRGLLTGVSRKANADGHQDKEYHCDFGIAEVVVYQAAGEKSDHSAEAAEQNADIDVVAGTLCLAESFQ